MDLVFSYAKAIEYECMCFPKVRVSPLVLLACATPPKSHTFLLMSLRITNHLGVQGRDKIPPINPIQIECRYHAFLQRWVLLEAPPWLPSKSNQPVFFHSPALIRKVESFGVWGFFVAFLHPLNYCYWYYFHGH